jgi:hypothetical protein
VALVEVDELGAEPFQRLVDLPEHLLAREPAAAVRRGPPQLRRENVRVAWPARERSAEHLLGAALAVKVRGVEEVDLELEGGVDETRCGFLAEARAERRPRAETDLRDAEIAVADAAILHYCSVSIWARCSRPE